MANSPPVICLVLVKNEAWILDRFLTCASLWADHIILADHQSQDESVAIARRYPKVTVLENAVAGFHEFDCRQLLIDAARRLPEPGLMIALDADEVLSPNARHSPEWQTLLQAPLGTVIEISRVNLLPDLASYWTQGEVKPLGFRDDGTPYAGAAIHSPRIPEPPGTLRLRCHDIKVLHYQFVHWERMQSKHRWYQCWERVHQPHRSALEIFRQYNYMGAIPAGETHPLPPEWLAGYTQQGIDMTSVNREAAFWWDREVLAWLDKYGPAYFRQMAIWEVDWSARHALLYPTAAPQVYPDPRSALDKWVHRWLRKTQAIASHPGVRLAERGLSLLGW